MAPGADRLLEVPGSPCGCCWMGPSPRFILEELTTLAIIQAYKSKHQLQQATNFWMFVANRHLEIQQMNEAVAICCRDAVQVGLDGQPVMMCWLIELEFSIKRTRLLELSQLRLSRMMCAASCERGSFWWFHVAKRRTSLGCGSGQHREGVFIRLEVVGRCCIRLVAQYSLV